MFKIEDLADDVYELIEKESKGLYHKKFSDIIITDEDEIPPRDIKADEYEKKITIKIDHKYFVELRLAMDHFPQYSQNRFFKKATKHGTALLIKELKQLFDVTKIIMFLLKTIKDEKDSASYVAVSNFAELLLKDTEKTFRGLFAGRHTLTIYPCAKWKSVLGHIYFMTGIPRSTLCKIAIILSLNTENFFTYQVNDFRRTYDTFFVEKVTPNFWELNLGLVLLKYKNKITEFLEERKIDEIVKNAILEVIQ